MKTFGVILFALVATASARRGPFPEALKNDPRFQNEISSGKIVGGHEVNPPYSIPHQVSFQNFGSHICGGSVISENYVLTAAHCCRAVSASAITIVAGEHSRREDEGFEQERSVSKATIHENFDSSDLTNDICLLKLSSPLKFNNQVKPVPLPSQGQQFVAGKALVSGWGTLSSGGSLPDKLQVVEVPLVSDADCKAAYGSSNIDAASMICAGEGGRDSCQGDSGGPMTCDGYHCGVVSWGYGCADPDYPGVYAETSNFINWINQHATL